MKKSINKKTVLKILLVVTIVSIPLLINMAFFRPTKLNAFIASKVYKTPANSAFTDDNFYKCVVDAYNKENSTSVAYTKSLTDAQLKTITTLSCSSKNVTSANGVNKLTNLIRLDISDNKISSLNVNANTKLTYLGAYLNQLTTITLTGAPSLTELNVAKNKLTSLDISKNTKLTTLKAYENELTSITLAGAPSLTELVVSKNKLTSLDVSNNTKLTSLDVSDNQLTTITITGATSLNNLDIYKNKLINLDVSKNTNLTHLYANSNELTSITLIGATSLKYLDIYKNKLTNLDVSTNSKLTKLKAYENELISISLGGATSLTDLEIYKNKLTSLDVNKNTKLTTLKAYENELISISLGGATSLTNLEVYKNKLASLDVSKNTKLTTLKAYENELTSITLGGATSLTNLEIYKNKLASLDISTNINLTTLKAYENELTSITLAGAASLTELDIHNNKLTSLDVNNNTKLTTLKAYGNKLTSIALEGATSLTNLQIYKNNLTSLDVSENINLITLSAYENELTSITLAGAISLTKLYVSNNELTNIDLSQNINLEYLDISSNKFKNFNPNINEKLKTLMIASNELTSITLIGATSLTELDIHNNKLTSLDVSKNTNLTTLKVYENELTSIILTGAISLKSLDVSNNKLRSLDVSNNINLTSLSAASNELTSITLMGAASLSYVSLGNNKLTSLDVSNNNLLEDLRANDNQLINLDVSKNPNLKDLYIINNSFYKNIIIYKGEEYKIDEYFLKLPPSKNVIITNLTAAGVSVNKELNTIKSELAGTYSVKATYKHDISYYGNYYSATFNFNVVEITSDKYKINNEAEYIYVGTDRDINTIKNILNIPEGITVNIDLENNKLQVLNENEILKEFKIISISSDIHDLSKDYIFEYKDDSISVTNATINKNAEKSIIEIKYNDTVLDSYKLVQATSEVYDLADSTIKVTDNTIEKFLEKINCINCDVKIYDGREYTAEGEFTDNNTLRILYKEDVLKEYNLTYSVSGVTLNKESVKLGLDNKNTLQLEAIVNPKNAENKNVTWTSSNEDVAIVDEKGLITSKGLGNATITVTTEDGGYTDTVEVEVIQIILYQITYKDGEKTYNEYYEEGDSVELKSLEKEGYTLIGWLDEDKEYKLTDEFIMQNEDVNLTSKWEANKYEVIYESNGGIIDKEKFEVAFDNRYGTLETPTKKGHTFKGWYLEDNFETLVNDETIVKTANNHKLYAKWDINSYKLEIDALGGTYEGDTTLTLDYNSTKEIIDPTRKGYTFKGWNITGTESTIENKTFTMGISDSKLTAEWELIIPEISNHKVKDNLITNLLEGIKVNELDLGLDEIYTIKVCAKNETEKTEGNIGTGDKLKIYLDDLLVSEYTLIVSGDVSGDGVVNIADVLKIADHTISNNILNDYEKVAAEVTNDKNINIADVLKIADYTLDKRISLNN